MALVCARKERRMIDIQGVEFAAHRDIVDCLRKHQPGLGVRFSPETEHAIDGQGHIAQRLRPAALLARETP